MALLFSYPSFETGGMPTVIDKGTELVLNARTTDENGSVWYRTQDEQWVIHEILFMIEDPPAQCASLPQVTP
jgi:hypothetical protein